MKSAEEMSHRFGRLRTVSLRCSDLAGGNFGHLLDEAGIGNVAYAAAHSKKLENRVHMVTLYTEWYSFFWISSSVRMSPAMAAYLADRLWHIGDIVKLIEEWEAQA